MAEGNKLILELLHSNIKVSKVFATEAWLAENAGELAPEMGEVTTVRPKEMERLSFQKNPQDVLAICEIPDWGNLRPGTSSWNFYLDDIRDPGNLGTIIRTADWFGLEAIYCSPFTVDCYNPKVIQATMGSIARVKVLYGEPGAFLGGQPVYAAGMEGLPVSQLPGKAGGMVAIGNEAHGVSEEILNRATPITIPRKGRAESLNAAMAAGIIMHEVLG